MKAPPAMRQVAALVTTRSSWNWTLNESHQGPRTQSSPSWTLRTSSQTGRSCQCSGLNQSTSCRSTLTSRWAVGMSWEHHFINSKWDRGLGTCQESNFYSRVIFGSVKEPKESLCLSVHLFGTKLSIGLNLHLRAVWVSLRSVSGQS